MQGDILLASGAEIFRVEETIFRIAQAYGVESSDAFVLSSGIFLTAGNDREADFARVLHIPLSAARLDRVTEVNQLSREIVQRKTYACSGQGEAFRDPEYAGKIKAVSGTGFRRGKRLFLFPVWRRLAGQRGGICFGAPVILVSFVSGEGKAF